MKKHLTYFVLTFAIMLGLTFSQAQAAVVIIDDFATGVDLSSFGTSSAVDDGFYSNVLGGYRDTRVFASSGGVSINYSPVVGNTIAFNALAGSSGYYVSHYNGIGTNGSLNLDLLGSNTTGNFTLIVNAANGTGTAHVSVVDNNDNHFSS
ncbi:MAG TPA: hypothetical protein DER01_00165, partial [Phycisphaerales bacterium]|nr:hypothetical protein [Phycisphaerales bacterium]